MPRLPSVADVGRVSPQVLRSPALGAPDTSQEGRALEAAGRELTNVANDLLNQQRREQEKVKRAQDNAFLAGLNADLAAERTKILLEPPTDRSDDTGPDDTVLSKSLARFDETARVRIEPIQDEELKARAETIAINSRTPFETTLIKDDINRRRNDAVATTDRGLSTLSTDAFRNPAITEQHLETGLGMIRQLAEDFNLDPSARQKSEATFTRSLFESHIRGFIERGDTKRAREILDSQALDDELGVDSIRKLDKEIETALSGERREVQADLKDHLASLQVTGVGLPGFKERAAAVFDAGPMAEIESQEAIALEVHGTVSSFPSQTAPDIADAVEALRPEPGEEDFADKQKVFNAAVNQARSVLKERAANPAAASLRVPGVRQESDEEGVGERIAAQRALGIPPSLTRPLTNAEADAIVANLGSTEDRAGTILSIRETYGDFYPQVISQLSEKGLDPRLGILASVADDPALSQTLAQVIDTGRTELKKGLAPTDVSEIREQTNEALFDFRQAVELGDFSGGRTEKVNQIISTVEDLGLFYFRQSGDVSESVERATNQVINNRFTITETFYIPNTSNGKAVDAEAVQAFAEQRQDIEFIRDFNPPGLGTSVSPSGTITASEPQLDTAARGVIQRLPRLRGFDFSVQRGDGPGQLEFFAPDEGRNPNPGRATIEIRNKDLAGRQLEDAIAGDVLHLLGNKQPVFDPEFRQLKERFISTLPEGEIDFARRKFEEQKKERPDEQRSFEDWFDQVWVDGLIRGLIFPDEDAEFVKAKDQFLTDDGSVVIDQMRRLLETEPRRAEGGISASARQDALVNAAVNSGFWVTNETGTGLFLMVPFAGGSALPLENDKGERYEFSFTDPLEIEREGLFQSFPGAGAPN